MLDNQEASNPAFSEKVGHQTRGNVSPQVRQRVVVDPFVHHGPGRILRFTRCESPTLSNKRILRCTCGRQPPRTRSVKPWHGSAAERTRQPITQRLVSGQHTTTNAFPTKRERRVGARGGGHQQVHTAQHSAAQRMFRRHAEPCAPCGGQH